MELNKDMLYINYPSEYSISNIYDINEDTYTESSDNNRKNLTINLYQDHEINLIYLIWLLFCIVIYSIIFIVSYFIIYPTTNHNCDFKDIYYNYKDVRRNISLSRQNELLFSSSFDGLFSIIQKYIEKIDNNKIISKPIVVSVLSISSDQSDFILENSIKVIKTFSSKYYILDGSLFQNETDKIQIDLIISKLLKEQSMPIIITNVTKIHPIAAKVFFKFCDGFESYCKSAFYLFLITSQDNQNYDQPKTLLDAEIIANKILKKYWNILPDNILLPLLSRIIEFIIYF